MINLRSIDLNLLTVFEAVFELRSQSRAADRLGMSQPAVSSAISRLRYVMNDPLFCGRPSGVVPTLKAEQFYEQVHRALNVLRQEIDQKNSFDPATTFRSFALAASFSGGVIYSPKLYQHFISAAPNTRLTIRTIDPESEIPFLLHDHRLDAAIHYGEFGDPLLEERLFSEDELVLIAGLNHPRIREQPTLEECIRENFATSYNLLYRAKDNAMNEFIEIIRALTVIELSSPLAVISAVRETDLLAVTNRKLADSFGEIFGIRTFKVPVELPSLRSYLIWPRSSDNDPGHRWFLNQLLLLRDTSGSSEITP